MSAIAIFKLLLLYTKMNYKLILIPSLLLLQIPTFPIQAASPSIAKNSICNIQIEDEIDGIYSTQELQALANKITVKVIGDNNGGSGTLIGKQGNNYLVLTNSHVVRGTNSIKLQTADGKTYSAEIIPQNNFKNSDISLLKFQSNQSYCLPEISTATPDITTNILASGFSGSTGKITFSSGEVKKTSKLKEGYEIGYSSNIEQGMSGGAILSTQGQLVGINGRSSYPIINSGYVYQNGKLPSETEIKEMRKLSWGIPISTVLARVDRNVLTAYKLPLPKNTSSDISQLQYTGWLGNLEKKAKQFTVRIDSTSNVNGSGIIIAREGNTYTVLTSAHVLCEREDATKPCGDFNYEIFAPDAKKYPVDKSSIKIEEGVDLAVVKFKSSGDYQIATLADYNPNSEDYIFTAGYPKLKNDSPWRLTVGKIGNKEEGLLLVKDSDFSSSKVGSLGSKGINFLTGGYELVYTSITYGGMSGGAVLDSNGRVIGIHGRAEGEEAYDAQTGDCGSSGSKCQIQIGFSLGIPVSTFLGLIPRLGVKPQKLENTRPSQLDTQQVESIKKAALTAEVSGGNATADKWLERGNQLLRLERYKEADKAFDEVIKRKPSFVHLAYFGKGFNLGNQDKEKESATAFEQAVKLKPDFVAAWRFLSLMYLNSDQYDKALIAANKTIQLQPKNPSGYFMKWVALAGLERYPQAQAAITEAIKLNPRAINYSFRGIIYIKQQKWDLALADLDKAIKLNPQSFYAYALRGIAYKLQEKWDLALADLNEAIKINPYDDDFNIYGHRGDIYARKEKWDLALADLKKWIELEPKNAEAYIYRGLVYIDKNEINKAEQDLQIATQLLNSQGKNASNRNEIFVLNLLQQYIKKQKNINSELANNNKIIQGNPENLEAYFNRGIIYKNTENFESAIADFSKVIELDNQHSYAYFERASIYEKQEKWGLAIADFTKLIQLNPKITSYYELRANSYRKQEKWNLALADYNKAIEIKPNFAGSYFKRGLFLIEIGNKQKGIQDLEKAAELSKAEGNTIFYKMIIDELQKIQK